MKREVSCSAEGVGYVRKMTRLRLTTPFVVLLLFGAAAIACSQSVRGNNQDNDGDGGMGGGDGNPTGDGDGDGDGDGGTGGNTAGSGGGTQTEAFEVQSVTPSDGALGVARDLNLVTLDFSDDVHPMTADTEHFSLTGPWGPVSVDVDAMGSEVELSLSEDLQLLATYSVEVDSRVASADGVSLGEKFSSNFTTEDGAWTATEPVEGDDTLRIGHVAPKAGIAANGDTLVVYQVQDENMNGLAPHARWYRQVGGWEAIVPLDPVQDSTCDALDVSVNASGDAVAAWRCAETAYIRQYRDGAWEAIPRVVPGSAQGRLHVAMLDSGAVIGAHQASGDRYASCFSATQASGYAPETELIAIGPDQYDTVDFDSLELAVSSSGTALLAWTIVDGESNARSIGTLRYNPAGDVWGQASVIPGSEAPAVRHRPAPALSENGQAVVLWVVTVAPGQDDLVASHFRPAAGWGPVAPIDVLNAGIMEQPRITVMGDDHYLVTYLQTPETNNLYSSSFKNGTWGEPDLLSDGLQTVQSSLLASDGRGNAFLVFGYDVDVVALTDPLELQMHRYSHVDSTWSDVSPIPAEPVYMSTMRLAAAPSGRGALTWIGISGAVYNGNPNQRVDVSLKRFE